MTDIASAAGLSLTATYRYFPNRRAIVHELALRSFEADDEMYASFAERAGRSLSAWIEDATRTYCHASLDDHQRLQIRAAIRADPELAALNYENSVAAAERIAVALIAEGAEVPRGELEQRALLLVKLFDGAINLAQTVPFEEREATIDRFARMAASLLLDDA